MLNKVILMGRLTREPEKKATAGGMSVCTFSLAVQRDFAKQGEERQTDFINITTFGGRAEFVSKYFSKGQLVAVCGRIQSRSWEDGEGNKRYATDVIADEVHFAEPKRETTVATSYAYTPPANAGDSEPPQGFSYAGSDDDLPF